MQRLQIDGGRTLNGEIFIGGMKNSALPIIFATILVDGECIIKNVPEISDIDGALKILSSIGASFSYEGKGILRINTQNIDKVVCKSSLISKMRASSYLMGAMLARFGEVYLPMPGGCNFGARPLDLHFKGFEALGAECTEENGAIKINAKRGLKSTKITLDKISVGATINIVLASVRLDGVTIIENVAKEPHVDDLIAFLNQCGAKIVRLENTIIVQGVSKLHGTEYTIFPDMIEALTYMCFLGVCRGELFLHNIEPKHLSYVCDIFKKMGFLISVYKKTLVACVNDKLKGMSVKTAPYPLFPTDLHPQFASLLCFSLDGGEIVEEIFPTRFAYVNELKKMGATIVRNKNTVKVLPSKMYPCELDATDLRAGACLVASALGTEGISTINNVNYIVRGYESLVYKLSSIGGKIKLLKGE